MTVGTAGRQDIFDRIFDNEKFAGPVLLVGRFFMAAVFIIFGVIKIINNARMRAYMFGHGVPGGLISLAIFVEVVGGILVLIGYKTRLTALLMAGFCIVATSLFHTQFSAGGELAHFTKDFAIAGGFLFMIAYGPGPLSVDARLSRSKQVRAGRTFAAQENKV